jgi:AcrR family transcriptional regulator
MAGTRETQCAGFPKTITPYSLATMPTGTRELQKTARRRVILDAARSLILDGKTRDFSMPELAQKAGVSLVTPYNLFGSKSSILLEIVREDIFEPVQAIGDLQGETLVDWIAELSRTLAKIYYRNRHFYRRMIVTLVAQESAESQRESLALNYAVFESVISRLQSSGKLLSTISAATLAQYVAHSVSGSLQHRLMERGTEDGLRRDIETGILLVLAGVCSDMDRKQLVKRIEALDKT